mmetsp:Transcript_44057/g.79203  ORF Transcript_44057/g.79203 Transcript_44057/m.79203 type:complete len:83 (-) Transcript_44057:947-1195(-)
MWLGWFLLSSSSSMRHFAGISVSATRLFEASVEARLLEASVEATLLEASVEATLLEASVEAEASEAHSEDGFAEKDTCAWMA